MRDPGCGRVGHGVWFDLALAAVVQSIVLHLQVPALEGGMNRDALGALESRIGR